MGYTIDIDTGGTFTDCFVHCDGNVRTVKVPTTPHDLTVCFLESIKAGARAFAVPVEDLLHDTDVIRFSNTIGTNTIIERDGAKIGLLVTAGQEAQAPTRDPGGRPPLVGPDMVAGLDEATDADGQVIRAPARERVLEAAQALIDQGARCLVVALVNAQCNPHNERLVRETIKAEYPRDYLGSVPVFLSADITPRDGYRLRINTTVLNAYIHAKLARLLYKAGEDLRRLHFRRNLLIGHNTGTVARVAKTRAINTYNSGPAAGLLGAREIGRLYGAGRLITTDMGGTSFDIGYVCAQQPSFALEPQVEGIPCNLPMLAIRALGAGGGSLVRVANGALEIGPESAGAVPGPACFALGGSEPTLTDANLAAGILDPDYFLGGSMRLDAERARAAIERAVAGPLQISVQEAAARIRAQLESDLGRAVAEVRAQLAGDEPALMVAYGGAGGIHACAIAGHAGIGRVVVTPYAAVSSAFGSSLLDAGHPYYRRIAAPLAAGDTLERMRRAVASMRAEAERDMRGEGFALESMSFELQLFVRRNGDGIETLVPVAIDALDHPDDLVAAVRTLPGAGHAADAIVGSIALLARSPVPRVSLTATEPALTDVSTARKGARVIVAGPGQPPAEVPVYAHDRLLSGHGLTGPAIVESEQFTLLVPQGWRLGIDRFRNALLEAVEPP
ncbi:MAG: hydantoinase/oxoprolinase family protein [Gammaproteobacteria bacterium]|nr:hydantoinase/oxoprolinase family protein [Gammaproteobacteria bacterium]